jgi:hypothetical protein
MLTDKPNIVIAHAPKRNRAKPKPAAVPAHIVVDHRKGPDLTEEELRQRGDAADRLFQQIKRRAAEQQR